MKPAANLQQNSQQYPGVTFAVTQNPQWKTSDMSEHSLNVSEELCMIKMSNVKVDVNYV